LSTVSVADPVVREELQTLAQAHTSFLEKKPAEDPNQSESIYDRWTEEHVLRMTNGTYLLYKFRHGDNMGFVPHLFLAHGSDGRWFYSSYHFCGHMASVRGEHAPGSIDEFAQRYSVREFDGKSKECLNITWPKR
jgi:hypothetical protein